ncbi:type IV toxin-antitoxin system AbiEi family antitoxin domain-containing protein [Cellulomonas sp. APG4]|uniref:type IV toxin-antitoxin system AbiEi family antitoxin domain-containing protein n=1 Tax=Cellulomonas sp. APG4 TaxID=1538656 RepID=UPI0013795ED1|nr:type IV toxin-antitoxin system AbiEi family antitoxin domain-containing protein [Cellulomonas sp. APG4]NCT92335.1 type IV toxin-antitoxin system AbiEi family antitoxin domain-containing protein [Cellulomonas sp. APG4]
MGVVENLVEHHGCARTGRIVRSRREKRELASLVASGAVVRVARGLYRLPDAHPVVVDARRVSALVTCVSLAAHLGMPLKTAPVATHVALPAYRGTPAVGGHVVHWDSGIEPDGVRVAVEMPRALRHAVRCLPLRDAVALGDAALNSGRVSLAGLRAQRPTSAGRLEFDRFIRLLDGRSASLPETFLRLGLRAAGADVRPQAMIDGVGFVDMLVDGVVVVEVDGYAYHSGRREFGEDRRRDRTAQLQGLPVLRFTYADAVHTTASAVDEVLEAVRRHRPGR